MAVRNITNRFLNENKRYTEAVVVTVPSVLKQGGGRSQALPEYVQVADALTAGVIEKDTLVTKAYLIVDEEFPTGTVATKATITIGGTTYFTGVDVDATGVTVSSEVDNLFATGGDVVVTLAGADSATGDITTGKLRVVVDTIHPDLKNGQYAN